MAQKDSNPSEGRRLIQSGGNVARAWLQYFGFVLIAAFFWLIMAYNKSQVQDVKLALTITDVPEDVIFINEPPTFIEVSIRDKGVVPYYRNRNKQLQLSFAKYCDDKGCLKVSRQELGMLVRGCFSKEANITTTYPDSLSLKYALKSLGKKVPISLDFTAKANLQYEINGAITTNTDYVTIYGDSETLADINEVYTYHVEETELKDTLHREVAISPIAGTKIVPRSVVVTIPVEKLIKKEAKIPVVVKNVPDNLNVITFPSSVTVSYLVPKSLYNTANTGIAAIVDYNDILYSHNAQKVEIRIGEMPMIYKNVSLDVDSAEYIVEKLGK